MQIRAASAMLEGPIEKVGAIKFSAPLPAENVVIPPSISLAYVNVLSIAQATIGYAMKAEMTAKRVGEMTEWESVNVTPFDVALLNGSIGDFQRYAQEMQTSLWGPTGLWHPALALSQQMESKARTN